jgi:hypothetical protein
VSAVLDRCNGPPCPACGCQDSEILQWPNDGVSWYATGRAKCRHCGTRFAFRPARAKSLQSDDEPAPTSPPTIDHQEPPPLNTRPLNLAADPTVCPECGGKSPAKSTQGRKQYRKCSGCGHKFATIKPA